MERECCFFKKLFLCAYTCSLSGINSSFNLTPSQQTPWIQSSCSIKMHQWPLALFFTWTVLGFIYSCFILNSKRYIHHSIPDCWICAFVPLCLYAYVVCMYVYIQQCNVCIKVNLFVYHPHPRCCSSKTDPQCLAALHCLLVYMGNDPTLELKVQMKAGGEFEEILTFKTNAEFLHQS